MIDCIESTRGLAEVVGSLLKKRRNLGARDCGAAGHGCEAQRDE